MAMGSWTSSFEKGGFEAEREALTATIKEMFCNRSYLVGEATV